MRNFTRRSLLKYAGGAAAIAGGLLPFAGRAQGAWGELPPNILTPPPNFGVLHIHLLGGMAPFESFYYRDSPGRRTRGFDSEVGALTWNPVCGPGTPAGLELSPSVFGTDANSNPVHLGPFAKPLWSRPDLLNAMRVVIQSHDLLPHEAAIPFALTGLRLGNPKQASLGASIAHRYYALDVENSVTRQLPYAYGLVAESSGNLLETTSGMAAVGAHPGPAKPLVLKIGPGFATLISQLNRANMTASKDALLDQYRAQYRDWLRKNNIVTRSRAFSDYDTSVASLFNAANLSSFLSSINTSIPNEDECAHEPTYTFENKPNTTKMMLQAAAYLMTQPAATRARHVSVIDGGIEPRAGLLPYDVHSLQHAQDTGTNLWNVLSSLAEIINPPGMSNPNKLNLSETLVVITTEFGRTPFKSFLDTPNLSSLGRDHWPQGFATVLMGGPITVRGVAGSFDEGPDMSAIANNSYSQTDFHSAALVAAGIDPFETEGFAVGQLTGSLQGIDHPSTLQNIKTTLLGL